MELTRMSARQQAALLKCGEISATELLEQTITLTEQTVTALNPISIKLYEQARSAAELAEKELARGNGGTLCGVPVTIKDSHFYAGVPCTNGSRTLADFIPEKSCQAVENLEQAGAIVFAKTTCPEFGLLGVTHSELYGRTLNPWDTQRTCGGSSGGAGVAVATGAGALSLGGDGGGSIRIPSAFCGVVGLKPSFERVPREPCFDSWKSLVSYGPMTRNVADARLMLDALTGVEPNTIRGKQEQNRPWRVVVSEDLGFAPIDDDVRRVFRATITALEAAGVELIEASAGLESSVQTWGVAARYDSWQHLQHADYDYEDVGEITRLVLDFGSQFNECDARDAAAERKRIEQAYTELFANTGADALLTPTVGCEAFPHGDGFPQTLGNTKVELPWLDWASFLYDANLTGMPALALPVGLGDDQLPISLQLLGPMQSDHELLDLAELVETLVDWRHQCLAQS